MVSIREAVTDATVKRLRDDVARALEERERSGLVLDLTGVDTMDSYITRSLHDLVVTAQLMGVRAVVCGLQPDVADTLVEMGMDLPGVRTAANIDGALRALARRPRPQQRARSPR